MTRICDAASILAFRRQALIVHVLPRPADVEAVAAVGPTLRQHGIDVTLIHNHSPRLFYTHFWGNDDPTKLAQGLRTALDQTNSRR